MAPVDRSHLFSDHAELTLRDWARRLRIFRFCRAFGGHANDGDSLEAAYGWGSEQELHRCLELAGDLGSLRDEARATFLLGLAKYYRGELHDADRLNLQAREWLERTGERYFQMQNYRALGLYALARDDLEDAERWLREAIPVGLEEGGRHILEVYRFLTETLVRQGRVDDAATLAEFAGRDVPVEDAVAQAYVLLGRAAVASSKGDSEAIEVYKDAIARLDQQVLPVEAADARVTFANVLRQFGNDDEQPEHVGASPGRTDEWARRSYPPGEPVRRWDQP